MMKRVEELEKAARKFGFYWTHLSQLIEQVKSECQEIQEAAQNNDRTHLQEEVGDLIHAALSLAVFCDLDPTETLQIATDKFEKRYNKVVELAKQDGHDTLRNQPFHLLMHYWNLAKKQT
jgi:uncharacterized protein YabN with tetrapyrrole methylase and pyrophosphatase domain